MLLANILTPLGRALFRLGKTGQRAAKTTGLAETSID